MVIASETVWSLDGAPSGLRGSQRSLFPHDEKKALKSILFARLSKLTYAFHSPQSFENLVRRSGNKTFTERQEISRTTVQLNVRQSWWGCKMRRRTTSFHLRGALSIGLLRELIRVSQDSPLQLA